MGVRADAVSNRKHLEFPGTVLTPVKCFNWFPAVS